MFLMKFVHLCPVGPACVTMSSQKASFSEDLSACQCFWANGRSALNAALVWIGNRLRRGWLLFFLVLALPVFSAQAQEGKAGGIGEGTEAGARELALMAQEPPLTQADLDVIILLARTPDEEDAAILSASGLSPLRLDLALTKVSFGMLILSGLDSSAIEGIPGVFLPNAEELALISSNIERFSEVDLGAGQNKTAVDSGADKN